MLNFYDYIANSKYFKTFRVDDLLLVEYKCVIPSDRVAFWSHNNYFAFVLTGQSRYYEGEKQYVIDAGQAMFVRKGAYIAEQHRKGDYCALAIFLSDEFIRRVVDKYAPSGIADAVIGMTNTDSVFPIAVEESLTSYFYSVLSYFSKEKAPSGELLKLKFEELVLNILANGHNPQLVACLTRIRNNGNNKICIRETMEQSFMYPMSLGEYARLCARSLTTFKADFQSVYNMSPGKWLIAKRMQYARVLLETTEHAISEVAEKSGFKNTAHFIRAFKDRFGTPPLQYRLREISQRQGQTTPVMSNA